MKKRDLVRWSLGLSVLIMLAIVGCTEDEPGTAWYSEDPQMIGPDGGTLTGFNGDVVMTIPEGALTRPVRLEIMHLPNGGGWPGTYQDEFLKPFKIEPYITFNKPVHLTMKCNGCLSKGNEIGEKTVVFVNVWGSQSDYCCQSGACASCFCCSNASSQRIETCIRTTGVIATKTGQVLGE